MPGRSADRFREIELSQNEPCLAKLHALWEAEFHSSDNAKYHARSAKLWLVSGMRTRFSHAAIVTLVGLLLPATAYAHGEQVLAYPLSALLAVAVALPSILKWKQSGWLKAAVVGVLLATIAGTWSFVAVEPADFWVYVLVLASAPLIVSLGAGWILTRWSSK